MKQVIYTILTLTIAISSFGQMETVRMAAEACEAGDLNKAQDLINEAMESDLMQKDAYAWYVKGFIKKEQYKPEQGKNFASVYREEAIAAIEKSIEFDKLERFTNNNKKAMTYLALSYYNDAVLSMRKINDDNHEESLKLYNKYRSLTLQVKPEDELREKDMQFYRSLASAYYRVYLKEAEANALYMDYTISAYKKVLEMEPEDYDANYNIAIAYYNRGVFNVRKINHRTEFFELLMIQEKAVALFKESLPFMEKAHAQRSDRKETLIGLMTIHRSLSHDEAYNTYKNTLESLYGSGKN